MARRNEQVLGLIWVYLPGDYSRMFRLRAGEAELNQGVVTAYAVVHAANRPSLAAFNGAGFVQRTAVRHIFLFRPTVSLPPMLADPPAPAPHA